MSARPGDRSPRARRGAASPPTLFALLALVTLPALTAAVQGAAPLRPVPKVDVSAMEPAVRQQVDAAQRSLAAAPGLAPAAAAASFGEAGKTYLLYAMLDAAAPCFENAAALAPGDFRWPYYAGVVAQRLGDLERAGDDFRRATALQSPFPAALCRLGEVELLRGDLDAAGKSFTAVLAFPPWAPEAHYGLGRVALQRGDARGAAEHLEAVLAAQPGASMAHAPLAAAYGRLGQLDRAKAQAALYGDGQVGFPDQLLHEVEVANAGNLRRIAAATQAFREGRFAEASPWIRGTCGPGSSSAIARSTWGTPQPPSTASAAPSSWRPTIRGRGSAWARCWRSAARAARRSSSSRRRCACGRTRPTPASISPRPWPRRAAWPRRWRSAKPS